MTVSSHEAIAAAARHFDAEHQALVADRSIQFRMGPVGPPAKPPAWLHAVGDWIAWALRPIGRAIGWVYGLLPDAPYARLLFWLVLAMLAGLLIWTIVDRLRAGTWRWRRRQTAAVEAPDDWAPDVAPARAWLREADALAAEGRFAEAAHHLLIRSVEDIARRRPRLVRPALTSRDIAAANAIPATARTIFGDIAALVERSLFGGRPVAADEWDKARAAYADFALAKAWA